ncbi:hypothetical protein [Mesobacillus maritimus]|uniref:hypothetical protein n=1 Tax=Mesobacillus maritimus TaxID=1643336 RepID=UPI0038507F53
MSDDKIEFKLVGFRGELTEEMKKKSLFILYFENGETVKEYPDGRIERGDEIKW